MSFKSPPGSGLLIVALAAACGSNQSSPTSVHDAGSSGAAGYGAAAGSGNVAGTGGAAGTGGDVGTPGGPVALDGVFNARDTGGLPTASGKYVRRNVLIRSGHLGELTSAGCSTLTSLGIHTVVDLRAASDAGATPDASCAVSSTDYYLADLPKILPPTADSYLQTLEATEPKLAAIFNHLAKDDGLPAVIHCVIGRDRASLVTAIVLLSLGVPSAQVLDDFVTNQDGTVTVEASWLQAALDRIDGAGGIESYLLGHGVTQVQLDKLRSMALE